MKSRFSVTFVTLVAIALGAPRAGADFTMYASEYGSGQVDQFDATGAKTVFASGVDHPKGVTVDGAGNVYVAAGNSAILKFAASGASLGTLTTAGLSNPYGIAYGPDGAIWAANNNDNTIHRFSTSGADLGVFASTNLSGPEAISFDHAGNVYVSNNYGTFGGTIREFSPVGKDLGIFATTPPSGPNGSAFDAEGNFYVVVENGQQIHEYSSTGVDKGVFAALTGEHPIGMAFAPDGSLFVTEFLSGKIRRFSSTGADLGTFASGLTQPTYLAFAPVRAVPEPASLALVVVGITVAGLSRLRAQSRRAKAQPA